MNPEPDTTEPDAGGDAPADGSGPVPPDHETEPPADDTDGDFGIDFGESATDAPAAGGSVDADDFTPEQIDALVAERDEFLEAYRRTAADFDNFRKLSQKRLSDEVARSQGAFVERMLPVLDAIDAARAQGGGPDGVEALAGALYAFLEKEGLARVAPIGEPFDPNVAEAVVHEPGDGEPIVSEVLRTGYLWQGRVIRAAMVKVSG